MKNIFHEVTFVKENKNRTLENKKLNEVRDAIKDCENAKEGKNTNTKSGFTERTFNALKRAINTFLVIGVVGETFNLAQNVITGKFFKHYDSYFQERFRDTVKSQDLMELQKFKREANEIISQLIKVKLRIKDKEKKNLIDTKINNLKQKIKEAERELNKV